MVVSQLFSVRNGIIALLLSFLIAFPDVKYDGYFTVEDGWIENITALAFLLSSIAFFISYYNSKGNGLQLGKLKTTRNWVFLFLSMLFFVAFGEEISWGQRIFNWSTPESLSKLNYQGETNIHNLDIFTFKDELDDSFLSTFLVFNAGRLFLYFWMVYMVILPLLDSYSKKAHNLIRRVNVPIPSLSLGLLMLCNLLISKMYKLFTSDMMGHFSGSIDEIKEGNYAIIIAVLSIHLKNKYKK